MEQKEKVVGLDEYQIEAWLSRLEVRPLEVVDQEDKSEGYDIDRILVLRLKNRRYATVVESGCSCYDSSDAQIELHPDKRSAMRALDAWKKEHVNR
jgi:hypothetical protein